MSKSAELEAIKSGRIQYKHAQIKAVLARFINETAISLSGNVVNASNADDVRDAIAAAKHPLLAEIAGLKASGDSVRDGRSSDTTSGGDGWFDVSGRVRRRIGAMYVGR